MPLGAAAPPAPSGARPSPDRGGRAHPACLRAPGSARGPVDEPTARRCCCQWQRRRCKRSRGGRASCARRRRCGGSQGTGRCCARHGRGSRRPSRTECTSCGPTRSSTSSRLSSSAARTWPAARAAFAFTARRAPAHESQLRAVCCFTGRFFFRPVHGAARHRAAHSLQWATPPSPPHRLGRGRRRWPYHPPRCSLRRSWLPLRAKNRMMA